MNTASRRVAELSELDVVVAVGQFLHFEQGYRVRTEIPSMGQSVDVAATRGRWLTFIEVKRQRWRRAFRQCRAHEIVADYICVALCSAAVSDTVVVAAGQLGYGIIWVAPESLRCRWVVQPTLNRRVWPPQRRIVAQRMREIAYVY